MSIVIDFLHYLIVFATLLLAKTQQVLDHGDQKPFFVFLMHGARYGADSPAQSVQILPRPLGAVHLIGQLLGHDGLCVRAVEMCQVDQCFPHVFVHVYGICVLHELSDHFALVIFDYEHFFGLGHFGDHDASDLEKRE